MTPCLGGGASSKGPSLITTVGFPGAKGGISAFQALCLYENPSPPSLAGMLNPISQTEKLRDRAAEGGLDISSEP